MMLNRVFKTIKSTLRDALPDETIVKWQYRSLVGRPLNLANPKGFHEKICWMRLHTMTPLHAYCTDKITAPAYVASRLGDESYLAKRYMVTQDPDEICAETIPARACMIKTNHDSGGVFPIRDTSAVNWDSLRGHLRNRLAYDYYRNKRESQYKHIRPALLVEELLRPGPGECLSDLKLFCFHGKLRFMTLILEGISTKDSARCFLDPAWNQIAVNRQRKPFRTEVPSRPDALDEIIRIAERLAEPFPFVRVDFLLMPGRIVVGEMTFTPTAGYESFDPLEFELEAGRMLDHRQVVSDWQHHLALAQTFEGRVVTGPPTKDTRSGGEIRRTAKPEAVSA